MIAILARHPPTSVAAGICYGRLDIGVRDSADVLELAARIRARAPVAVWTSPSRRCRLVADALGIPVRLDDRLLELDFGAWEGRAWAEVPCAALDAWAADPLGWAPPGGESGAALVARVCAVAADLRDQAGPVAVVTHGGVLRLLGPLLRAEAPDPLRAAPACGSIEVVTA